MGMRNYPSAPNTIDLAITYNCNLGCRHCNLKCNIGDAINMPFKTIQKLFMAFSKIGVFQVYLQGGEPFLHPEIFDILKWIRSNSNLRIIINTNGLKINSNILSMLSYSPNIELVVSLYEEVLENSSNSNYYKQLFKRTKVNKIRTSINYLVRKDNMNRIENRYNEFIDFVNCITLIKYAPIGSEAAIKQYDIPYSDWKKCLLSLTQRKRLGKLEKLKILLPSAWEFYLPLIDSYAKDDITDIENLWGYHSECSIMGKGPCCSCGLSTLFIGADGKVYPCSLIGRIEKMCIDNIYDNNILDIWNNNKTLSYIRSSKTFDLSPVCKKCDIVKLCRGGCYGYSLLHKGFLNYIPKDDRCPMYEGD